MPRLIFPCFLFLVACNSGDVSDNTDTSKKADNTKADSSTITPLAELAGCYAWTVRHDTAIMNLAVNDKKVAGELSYNWYEKDRNTGTFSGIIKDSLIIADYTFQAEGTTSVREVVFKIRGGVLLEGFGEYDTGPDTLRFKNIDELAFQQDRKFARVICNSK